MYDVFTVICIIYFNGLILFVLIVLIISMEGIAYVTIIFNTNMIIMMIIFVVISIFTFVRYYMRGDVSSENFKLLKVLFLGLIVLMLVSYRVFIFIG